MPLKLTKKEKTVYELMLDFAEQTGNFILDCSIGLLAGECGIGKTKYSDITDSLCNKGLIRQIRPGYAWAIADEKVLV